MELGARPVLLAPRPPPPPPSLAAIERFARLETFRRARAHHRSEMRRPLSERRSERRAERAALAKAEMRARRSAKAARERRLDRVHEAAEILRFAMSMAREYKRIARDDERHARFLKQDARHFRSQERMWIQSYPGDKELEWKQWDYFPNVCAYVLEEARMAEALAGETRMLADEAGDLLRKAHEAMSGSPGAMRRLRSARQRFLKASEESLLWQRQAETKKEHKAILTRRTYPVLPTAGSACASRYGYPPHGGSYCCGIHRAVALKLGWTEYPRHVPNRGFPERRAKPGLLAPEHPCEVPTVWYLSSEIRNTFNWH